MVVKRNARKRVTKKEIGEFTHNEFTAFIGVPFHHMGGPITSEKLLGALEITQSMSVLDVGCGSGYTPCLIAKRYRCNVIGVDISEYMISKANELAAEERLENVTFRVADAHKLPFDDEEFDIIIAESVLMFIPDKQPVLHELLRVLKPNGYIGNLESCLKPNLPQERIQALNEALQGVMQSEVAYPTQAQWEKLYMESGVRDIRVEAVKDELISQRELLKLIGYKTTIKVALKSLWYMIFNGGVRKTLLTFKKLDDLASTKKGGKFLYVGVVIITGKKAAR